ncbi:tRNA lysidine(34) synthetase TilS [Arsenophonus endosymbiont of Aphis craccivora]|uniref:tRNA lysidine(34) synthetase TilS n=1 Tax=Arsenophonus endosymbiont of Aphis craccivora TaxID=1231049 RepID=UPI0015DC0ABA|nr:tRNA lysidine(34) synthetase TilS [Arsenophonus endosymbiont of Aphis craccivora]QLK88549.1 tRNA lysidine(34) synthetase TilS [Arsenophonus endosymbiont of Aphis craccivora]
MNVDEAALLNQIIKTIGSTRRILVGFSGGLDSTVLLHALVSLRQTTVPNLNIRAVYIHHGLNDKADDWAIHCQKVCFDWQVEFSSQHVYIDPTKKGIEAAARDARYQVFREILLPEEIIVTAQHLNDQAETFLLALKRGSGPAGLSAMPISIPFADTNLIRPLLSFSRQQFVVYAEKKSLSWIEDDSNQDERYDRNFLRLAIMPHFNRRWPHFSQAVARSASLCAEQEALLNELLQDYLSQLVTAEGALQLDTLANYSEMKRNALLRRWVSLHRILMPSRVQLKQIWQDVICARPDAEPQFILANNNVIRRFKQQLWLLPQFNDLTKICLAWQLPASVKLPDNLGTLIVTDKGTGLRAPLPHEQVTIRFGLKGNIKIIGRQHARRSKKLWQELGVAPWLRERTPLIYYNDELIAAVGVFITQSGKSIQGQSELKIKWITDKKP